MIYYRLLRDNKETGPYSEEEMIAKGFKPYDLLWADGKSAGWQYPSEIIAFKKHAPIVEEQPFDRFYKKQPAQKSSPVPDRNTSTLYTPLPLTKPDEKAAQKQTVSTPVYNYHMEDLPARHIHVTLPSGNTVNLTNLATKNETIASENRTENIISRPVTEVIAMAAEKPVDEKKQFIEYNSLASGVLPHYRNSTPVPPAESNKRDNYPVQMAVPASASIDFSWSLILGAVLSIAALVGLGIMIGLSLNRNKNNAVVAQPVVVKSTQINSAVKTAPVETIEKKPVAAVIISPVLKHPVPEKNNVTVKNDIVRQAGKSPDKSSAPFKTDDKKPVAPDAVASDNVRTAQHRDDAVDKPKVVPVVSAAKINIEKSLTVNTNHFKTGAFGGITGLTCTLFNGSKSPLEAVDVEVDYIQANNKIFKTEVIRFKDVSAGSQSTIDAPASTRGIKVVSRVVKVSAKDIPLVNTTAKS